MAELTDIGANELYVLEDKGTYVVWVPDGHLATPSGQRVESLTRAFLEHMVSELQQFPVLRLDGMAIGEPRVLSAYWLYASMLDCNAIGSEDVWAEVRLVDIDPFFHPTPGPEEIDQRAAWMPIKEYLQGNQIVYAPYYAEEERKVEAETALRTIWERLTDAQKSVVLNLSSIHENNVTSAFALVEDGCTEIEYANAVLATSLVHYTFSFPVDDLTPEQAHGRAFTELRDAARTAIDFLRFNMHRAIQTEALIRTGESKNVEFKSSLRWNLRTGKNDRVMTHACLKTISAFLNTAGGWLLIGVADDGQEVGIQHDGFTNADKFLLHLYDAIRSSLGEWAASCVDAKVETIGNSQVCKVRCESSPKPIYLKEKSGEEEFYVRHGPGSKKLGLSSIHPYITTHFGEGGGDAH